MSGSFLRLFRLELCGLGLFAALAAACTPKIGDSCSTSADCSASGDRLCDNTQPGGYCTIFNCEPGGCPADSVCVNFGAEPSDVPGCQTGQGSSPYQRAFCMASCSSNSDCRTAYTCEPLGGPNRWSAVVVDLGQSTSVCMANTGVGDPAHPDGGPPHGDVCRGSDAGPSGDGGEAGAPN